MLSDDGSGDIPLKLSPIPQHSTPIKSNFTNGPVLFTSLGTSLPTSVQNGTSSPTEQDQATVKRKTGSPVTRDHHTNSSSLSQQEFKVPNISTSHSYFSRLKQVKFSGFSDADVSIIQKQSHELQLLISELRDRDRELNDMVAAHQSQLLAWEEDRQKVLTLQQRSTRYEDEIMDYKKSLKKLAGYVKLLKAEKQTRSTELQEVKDKLSTLNEEKGNQTSKLFELREKDRSMNEAMWEMSTVIGHYEARETELTTVVKLKDKDLSEVSRHITELNGRLHQLDMRCRQYQDVTVNSERQATEWKAKCTELKKDYDRLRDKFNISLSESRAHVTELERTRQRITDLEREWALAGERECRKDELIESTKAKQERTILELSTLRELFDRQQRELSILQLNLDTSREIIAKQVSQENSLVHYSNQHNVPQGDNSEDTPSGCAARNSNAQNSPRTILPTSTAQENLLKETWVEEGEIPESAQQGAEGGAEKSAEIQEEGHGFDELYLRFLQDTDIPSVNSSFVSVNLDELDRSLSSVRDNGVSPTSKLHRLLAESRLMVEKLEHTTISPEPSLRKEES